MWLWLPWIGVGVSFAVIALVIWLAGKDKPWRF